MKHTINTKELRAALPDIVRRTRLGQRFLVLYRSRPAFQVVPVDDNGSLDSGPAEEDPLFGAEAVGRSSDGRAAKDHDRVLYRRGR